MDGEPGGAGLVGGVGGNGGAVYVSLRSPRVSNCVFVNNVAVGRCLGDSAYLWTWEHGALSESEIFEWLGIDAQLGTSLALIGVSSDGNTICGVLGQRGFVSRLAPWSRYGVGVSQVIYLELTGDGATQPGALLSLKTTGARGSAALLVLGTESDSADHLGGEALVELGQAIAVFSAPTIGDQSTHELRIPGHHDLVGRSFFFQSASIDTTEPEGWALSNGLKVVACEP